MDCAQFSPKGQNSFAYCDSTVDAGEPAGLSTDNPLERVAIYHPLELRIHDTVPFIPLYVSGRQTAIMRSTTT